MRNDNGNRPLARRCLRAAATLAATGAMLGAVGAGTASAHESEPSGGPLGAVQESGGALLHHVEEYHLSKPTWEIESLLTSPQENIRVHKAMLDEIVDPLVGLLP
ncbi:hypothetical protein AB0I53_10145 [Saccharopolyspora sp. NPDC050389]|uniref:hypothetical protein n=1 Tax=Saccharopolyspora sp. NPDC050389 TaxID=3155516 RepID=UPI0033C12292